MGLPPGHLMMMAARRATSQVWYFTPTTLSEAVIAQDNLCLIPIPIPGSHCASDCHGTHLVSLFIGRSKPARSCAA